VNWNFPQVAAHRPLTYQGLNLPILFTEQLISHVQTLMKFGSHGNDITGNLIWANAELLCLETGVGGPLFQIPLHFQSCVTLMWFSQCWSQCVQWGIEIITDIPVIAHQWQHDNELMTLFTWWGLPRCRLSTLEPIPGDVSSCHPAIGYLQWNRHRN